MTTPNWIDLYNTKTPEAIEAIKHSDSQTIELMRAHVSQAIQDGSSAPEALQMLRDACNKLTEGLSVSENTSLLMLQGRHRDALDNHLRDLDLNNDQSFELLCLLDMENFRLLGSKP